LDAVYAVDVGVCADEAWVLVGDFCRVSASTAATITFSTAFTASFWKDYHLGTDSFRDGVQLGPAYLCFEELQVATLHADYSETWATSPLAYVAAFPHKNLRHFNLRSWLIILGICPK
jgi:hypothetical protein